MAQFHGNAIVVYALHFRVHRPILHVVLSFKYNTYHCVNFISLFFLNLFISICVYVSKERILAVEKVNIRSGKCGIEILSLFKNLLVYSNYLFTDKSFNISTAYFWFDFIRSSKRKIVIHYRCCETT